MNLKKHIRESGYRFVVFPFLVVVFCAVAGAAAGFFVGSGLELASLVRGSRYHQGFDWRAVLSLTFWFAWAAGGIGLVVGIWGAASDWE